MSHEHHPTTTTGDTLYETFYSGAIGGAAVAGFFLIVDLLRGAALRTPTITGHALLSGGTVDTGTGVATDLTAVAAMTLFHVAAFLGVGFVASVMARGVEERTGGGAIGPILALFVLLEVPAFLVSGVLLPELGSAIGHGLIAVANLLAAIVMTLFLRHAHTTAELET